eukprot:gene10042-10915_t
MQPAVIGGKRKFRSTEDEKATIISFLAEHNSSKTTSSLSINPPPNEAESGNLVASAIIDQMIQAFNVSDMNELKQLLADHSNPFFSTSLKCLDYKLRGTERLLSVSFLTHECFPDACLTILDRRRVNLTRGKSQKDSEDSEDSAGISLIQVEYICKFTGTKISHEDFAFVLQSFFQSLEEGKPSNTQDDMMNIAMVDDTNDDGAADFARFISKNFTQQNKLFNDPKTSSTDSKTTPPTNCFILEIVFTFDNKQEKITHCAIDILASSTPWMKNPLSFSSSSSSPVSGVDVASSK